MAAAVGYGLETDTSKLRICGRHFASNVISAFSKRLLNSAVPSIFLGASLDDIRFSDKEQQQSIDTQAQWSVDDYELESSSICLLCNRRQESGDNHKYYEFPNNQTMLV